MPNLSHKTKNGASPQGKPRVYFCCHPDDFDRFFEEISEEIMKNQDCALYYDSEPFGEINEEEWLSYLAEMKLFVMPVTTRLLTSENKALNLEFRFAEKMHIPILPLMQENGLEELFKKKIGSLQYLNKNNADSTSISYEKKLDVYLDSILVGNELAAKIRAAFDAYIFLSYRKKDRVYAQELMRLIHKNDFCRDIAIWYDEFLTPGENFNNSIEEALKKSELFALAVTPNLVNEENYVMKVEYPMAKKAGKTILPAEIVETDITELRAKYEDIPECADAHNESELSQALLNALKSIALRENDNDPRHNFFIGLAYLSGIDVEVNHERALELITSAADDNLPEAIEKLVAMYRNGDGVERNYETAIEWQIKLADFYKKIWEDYEAEEDALSLCLALLRLGDYYYEIFKCNKAIKAYSELRDFSKALFDSLEDLREEALYFLATANNNLGNAYRAAEETEAASQLYEQAILVLEETVKASNNYFEKCDLCAGYSNLAYTLFMQNQNARAEEVCQKAINLGLELKKIKKDNNAMNLLSLSYNTMGDGLFRMNRLDESLELHKSAVENDEDTVKLFPCSKSKNMLCRSLNNLGENYAFLCDFSKAEECYTKALGILTELYSEIPELETKINISDTHQKLYQVYAFENNFIKAETEAIKSLNLIKELLNETELTSLATEAANSCADLGDMYVFLNQQDKAIQMYHDALNLLEGYKNKDTSLTTATVYNKLGEIYINIGEIDKARPYCEKGLKIAQEYIKTSEYFRAKDNMIVSYNSMARIYELEGDVDAAMDMYKKAFELSETMGNENTNIEIQFIRAVVCHNLGYMHFLYDDSSQAETMYLKAIEILKDLIGKTNSPAHKRIYSECYIKLGLICLNKDEYEKAEALSLTACELYESLYAESGYIEDKASMIRALIVLSSSYLCSEKPDKAKENLDKAFSIKNTISEDYVFQFVDRISFVQAKLSLGIVTQNRDILKEALKEAKELRSLMPDSQQIKDLIKYCKRILLMNRIPLLHKWAFGLSDEE